MGNLDAAAGVDLPEPVARALGGFVTAAEQALGPDLVSIVLFGSGAEGRLRSTSDVNLIVVLRSFVAAKVDELRDPLRTAHAAIRVETMFLLESEIAGAIDAFTVKFADVLRRRRVLYGRDPFARVVVPRSSEILRLRQVLLNQALRLRERYVLLSLREEQAALAVADAAGPLRTSAAALLELEGRPAASPKEALGRVVSELGGVVWDETLVQLSAARETRSLPAGTAGPTLLRLAELARLLYDRAIALR
jgi:predicted nucleotidyltransferase